MKKEVKLYKTTSVIFATEPDSVFFVKGLNETVVRTYITTSDGQAIPLKDLSGGGGGSGIEFLASSDSSIAVTGTTTSKNIQVSSALQALINSALQSGDSISTLINDSGYITLADVPTFNPSDYDLSDFTNTSSDPFVKQSEITGGATNLSYTANPSNGIVTSDTGSDATIPLADLTNAGLLSPAEKGEIATAVQPSDLGAVATSNDYGDLDNIPPSFPPSAHTHVEADIIDLDKYTQSETDTLLDGKVPYTGATTNVDLGEFQLKVGQIEFDQTPTGTFGVGKVRWNDTDGTTERRLKGNNVTLQDGQEIVKRIVNKTGADLLESEYKVVRLRSVSEGGAQGQRSAVVLAQADTNLHSKALIGVVTEDISNNQEGFITLTGEVRNINTTGGLQSETWVDGDQLYLSATVAGQLTNVVPTSPNYSIAIATVDHAHITQGKISVHTESRLALDVELSGDNDTSPSVTAVKTYVDNKVKPSFMILNTPYTGVSGVSPQKLFNVGSSGNGEFNALANKTYEFICEFDLTNLALGVSSTISFGFLGTVGVLSINFKAVAAKGVLATATTSTITSSSTATTPVITASNTQTTAKACITGTIRTSTAGTLQPAFSVSVSATPQVEANSIFIINEIGDNTVTHSNDIT